MASSDLRPMYKKLLKLAQTLPADKRQTTVEQIRREFRTHNGTKDPKEIAALLARAQSSIGYLKIVTPRATSDAGVKNYVYIKGKRVEAAGAAEDGARYKTADYNAQMQRHVQLLRRQHFMDRK
uniref:Complex 1 LYR protein domain-containing protein n=1 Tax=Globisporangium ultimum (strain ATCC 200006 / CBS 805.95 / DAOM BR144) TaxID=431595 RepID=K3W9U6_GLOUD